MQIHLHSSAHRSVQLLSGISELLSRITIFSAAVFLPNGASFLLTVATRMREFSGLANLVFLTYMILVAMVVTMLA